MDFTLRCMPSAPMSQDEMQAQCRLVSDAAEIAEELGINESNEPESLLSWLEIES